MALDGWRGLTIVLMILVNNVSLGHFTPPQLVHAAWHGGLTPTDLVFPWFLFCAGAALPFSPLPLERVLSELSLTNQTLEGLTRQPIKYFRPPGGDYTPQTLGAARALGLTTVFWTDAPGGIVLLHDNAQETLSFPTNSWPLSGGAAST